MRHETAYELIYVCYALENRVFLFFLVIDSSKILRPTKAQTLREPADSRFFRPAGGEISNFHPRKGRF